jgi:hypothetical protein
LRVVPFPSTVAAGEIVNVDVIASSNVPVVDAPLHLNFDPNVLAYVDATPGEFLAQGASSVVFVADGQTRPGDVALGLGRLERTRGAEGQGILCRVRFRGLSIGRAVVSVGQALAWDAGGHEVTVLSSGASVVVR